MGALSRGDPEGGAGGGVPRLLARSHVAEARGHRRPGTLVGRSSRRRSGIDPEKQMRGPSGENRHGWSAERRASLQAEGHARRLASAGAPGTTARLLPRVRLSALHLPPRGRRNSQASGAPRRERAQSCLKPCPMRMPAKSGKMVAQTNAYIRRRIRETESRAWKPSSTRSPIPTRNGASY